MWVWFFFSFFGTANSLISKLNPTNKLEQVTLQTSLEMS